MTGPRDDQPPANDGRDPATPARYPAEPGLAVGGPHHPRSATGVPASPAAQPEAAGAPASAAGQAGPARPWAGGAWDTPPAATAQHPAGAVMLPPGAAGSAVVGRTAPETGADSRADREAEAGAAATAAASAAPPVASPAAPIAIPDAGRHQPPGTVVDTRRPPDGSGQPAPSGRLTRLHAGSHTASLGALAQLRIAAPETGVIMGVDRQQRPVPVRLFRPDPLRVAVIGGLWACQLVAFRALAVGARIAVVTTEPYSWHSFGERSTGHSDRVLILPAEQPLTLPASARRPVLVVYDLGLAGTTAPQPLGPWQTELTLVRQLDQSGVTSINDCELLLMQRLGATEAALAGAALRLPPASVRYLQVMPDDMMALVAGGTERYLWLSQTEVERRYGGNPRR